MLDLHLWLSEKIIFSEFEDMYPKYKSFKGGDVYIRLITDLLRTTTDGVVHFVIMEQNTGGYSVEATVLYEERVGNNEWKNIRAVLVSVDDVDNLDELKHIIREIRLSIPHAIGSGNMTAHGKIKVLIAREDITYDENDDRYYDVETYI